MNRNDFIMDLFWDSLRIRLISMNSVEQKSGFGRYDVMMIPKIKETKSIRRLLWNLKSEKYKKEKNRWKTLCRRH